MLSIKVSVSVRRNSIPERNLCCSGTRPPTGGGEGLPPHGGQRTFHQPDIKPETTGDDRNEPETTGRMGRKEESEARDWSVVRHSEDHDRSVRLTFRPISGRAYGAQWAALGNSGVTTRPFSPVLPVMDNRALFLIASPKVIWTGQRAWPTHTDTHTSTHGHKHTHTGKHTYRHTHTHTHTHTQPHTRARGHAHTQARTHHTHTNAHTRRTHEHTRNRLVTGSAVLQM